MPHLSAERQIVMNNIQQNTLNIGLDEEYCLVSWSFFYKEECICQIRREFSTLSLVIYVINENTKKTLNITLKKPDHFKNQI